jgi:phage gp29-like protein
MPKPPTKADLLQRLQDMEAQMLTRGLETVQDHRNEPFDMLGSMSAERVHAAIIAAERGETWELFAIFRDVLISDTHMQGLIETRFQALLGDEVMISPKDPTKPEDVAAAAALTAAVDRLPGRRGTWSWQRSTR